MARRPKPKLKASPLALRRYSAGSYNFVLKNLRKALDASGIDHKLAALPGESEGS